MPPQLRVSYLLGKAGVPVSKRNLPPIVQSDFDPAALEPLKARALAELEGVQGVAVNDEDDAAYAAQALVSIAAVRKDCEKQSKEWLAPVNAEKDRIRKPFKAIEDLCDAARKLLDDAIGKFQLARALEQRRQLAAATEAVKADNSKALTTALQAVASNAPAVTKGVTVKAFWVATVTAPDLVPYEYLAPDLQKIGAHASACPAEREPTPIPGVQFKLETSTTVRTKGLV